MWAIFSIGAPPSDQLEWVWQSPRSAARYAAPSGDSGITVSSSSLTRYDGVSPFTASVMTLAVTGPMWLSSVSVPAFARASTSAGSSSRDRVPCVREGLDAMGGLERAVEQEDDAIEGGDGIHDQAGFTVSGIDVHPRSRKLCVPTISPLGSKAEVRSKRTSAVTRASSRARGAPRHRWMPCPKPT